MIKMEREKRARERSQRGAERASEAKEKKQQRRYFLFCLCLSGPSFLFAFSRFKALSWIKEKERKQASKKTPKKA